MLDASRAAELLGLSRQELIERVGQDLRRLTGSAGKLKRKRYVEVEGQPMAGPLGRWLAAEPDEALPVNLWLTLVAGAQTESRTKLYQKVVKGEAQVQFSKAALEAYRRGLGLQQRVDPRSEVTVDDAARALGKALRMPARASRVSRYAERGQLQVVRRLGPEGKGPRVLRKADVLTLAARLGRERKRWLTPLEAAEVWAKALGRESISRSTADRLIAREHVSVTRLGRGSRARRMLPASEVQRVANALAERRARYMSAREVAAELGPAVGIKEGEADVRLVDRLIRQGRLKKVEAPEGASARGPRRFERDHVQALKGELQQESDPSRWIDKPAMALLLGVESKSELSALNETLEGKRDPRNGNKMIYPTSNVLAQAASRGRIPEKRILKQLAPSHRLSHLWARGRDIARRAWSSLRDSAGGRTARITVFAGRSREAATVSGRP